MARAKNKVVAGKYKGRMVVNNGGFHPRILGFLRSVPITSKTVEAYELITDDHRKSAASGVARGLIGGVLLGPVGMLAGVFSAKNRGIYQVAIQFKNGEKSLLEIDEKIFKVLVKSCF